MELETIESAALDHVNGGVDMGMAHTVLTQSLSCASAGAMIGGYTLGVPGAAGGAIIGGAACAATSYLAMKQAQQQPSLPQASTPLSTR